MLYDRIAVEKHIYTATRSERIQNSKHSLTVNAHGGTQQSLNQRPDFAQAKTECKRLHARRAPGKDPRRIQNLSSQSTNKTAKGPHIEGNEECDYAVDPKTGLEVLQRVAGKPAGNFVRIAGQLANSFVLVVILGPNPF